MKILFTIKFLVVPQCLRSNDDLNFPLSNVLILLLLVHTTKTAFHSSKIHASTWSVNEKQY